MKFRRPPRQDGNYCSTSTRALRFLLVSSESARWILLLSLLSVGFVLLVSLQSEASTWGVYDSYGGSSGSSGRRNAKRAASTSRSARNNHVRSVTSNNNDKAPRRQEEVEDEQQQQIKQQPRNSRSLLDLNLSAAFGLPPCSAVRHSLTTSRSKTQQALDPLDPTKPTIYTDWNPPALEMWSDRDKFVKKYGNHPQYVKMGDVQPLKDKGGDKCTTTTSTLVKTMAERFDTSSSSRPAASNANTDIQSEPFRRMKDDLLFFTNNVENPTFLDDVRTDYAIPEPLSDHPAWSGGNGFRVFSAMESGSSHPFHFHDEAWLGQVSGSRLWYLLPPGTPKSTVGSKVNACDYLSGRTAVPVGAQACVQNAGEVMYLPAKWLHATCALEEWSVGVGGQGGSPASYEQDFSVPVVPAGWTEAEERNKLVECGAIKAGYIAGQMAAVSAEVEEQGWKWFDGNLGEYYDKLERDEHGKRNPNVITSYAVHRWMGPKHSTLEHYKLIRRAIYEVVADALPNTDSQGVSSAGPALRVFDAGCGLGAGLMWMEQHEPNWTLVGHTISEEQYKWITEDLPEHRFTARLRTYDEPLDSTEPEGKTKFHAVYSIEAAIHSPNLANSIKAWSDALQPGGVVVLIDDFLSVGVPRDDQDVDLFARSWLANSVHTTMEIAAFAEKSGMQLVRDRDIGNEYRVIKLNYRNKAPELRDELGRAHQGWLGSKVRQRLTVQGKLSYRLVVLRKKGVSGKKLSLTPAMGKQSQSECPAVPKIADGSTEGLSMEIESTLMTGKGKNGGKKQACLSGWYCCDKGGEYWDDLEANRTTRTKFLELSRDLFGNYLASFAKHLTDFYRSYPPDYPGESQQKGIFLDIGGTGSVASGMQQVTSKFAHFAGPLDYWVLDSDPDAKKLSNAIVCDVDDCPEANDCSYDVTFSFTVLEHAVRPWKAFDTIARITKKGGLTLHLVPWSYQYHATPDDNYRFSHKALTSLLEDRGFEVLDVGYDICTQPEHVRKNQRDEHYEVIWLTYVVGRKL